MTTSDEVLRAAMRLHLHHNNTTGYAGDEKGQGLLDELSGALESFLRNGGEICVCDGATWGTHDADCHLALEDDEEDDEDEDDDLCECGRPRHLCTSGNAEDQNNPFAVHGDL